MSVWPKLSPVAPSLTGREGTLVSISIHVDPRHLESLLEALAQVSFPVNPQIYHDASLVYRYADGHEEAEPTTLVEFPAYAARLDEVRQAVDARGFDDAHVHVSSILEAMREQSQPEPAPSGSPYSARFWRKSRLMAAAH